MAQPVSKAALASVLAELPGRWVAVSRTTNEPVAAADSPDKPDKPAIEIRERTLTNLTVVRAPDPSEPDGWPLARRCHPDSRRAHRRLDRLRAPAVRSTWTPVS